MRRSLAIITMALPTLLLTGCYNISFVTEAAPFAEQGQSLNNPFFLWGLVGENTFDARKVCPNGVAKMNMYKSGGDGFVQFFTLGLYSPRTVDIWCTSGSKSSAKRALLGLTDDGRITEVITEHHDGSIERHRPAGGLR
jgi:hypothetical protein